MGLGSSHRRSFRRMTGGRLDIEYFEPLVLRIVGRFPRGRGKPAPIANARGCAVLPTTLLPPESPTLLRTNSDPTNLKF